MDFYYIFRQLCDSVNKSPAKVAGEIGTTRASIGRWKKGSQPSDVILLRIANYFGVPIESLRDENRSYFYKKLVELCEKNNTSPSAVAEKIGLTPSSAVRWKQGNIPNDDNFKKLADYFGVSIEYLKGETENPSADNGKGEGRRTIGSLEDKEQQGFETVNINVNTLGDVTELVECVKGLSSEKIQLLISVAKSMK